MGEENKKTAVAEEAAVKKNSEPSYEQLKNWCDQLMMQRSQLAEKLNQVTSVLNRIPWLFKIIENKEVFPTEFIERCKEEIIYIMTPPAEEATDDKPKGE